MKSSEALTGLLEEMGTLLEPSAHVRFRSDPNKEGKGESRASFRHFRIASPLAPCFTTWAA